MRDYNPQEAQAASVLEWIIQNKMVGESGQPLEFVDHKFLVLPYSDLTPQQAIRKSAQVGWSTLAIVKASHLARFALTNIIYTLPSRSIAKDFVQPKVDPIIQKNEQIRQALGETDSISLKKIGDRFIYFRGSWEEKEAIMISADILMNDEFDRSKPKVLETYQSRLSASEFGWQWSFSNPTVPNVGVDNLWISSNQRVWLVKCSHCGFRHYLSWKQRKNSHTIDRERGLFICGKCKGELTNQDRRSGQWYALYPDRRISGYWLSHLFCPWISAQQIIEESKGDPSYFHNFVLGEPYVSPDILITRKTITNCLAPTINSKTNCAMGIDNGVVKHWVLGNSEGIFAIGKTEDWQEIENMIKAFNPYVVIDAQPYPTIPQRLAEKYSKVFLHWYYTAQTKKKEVIEYGKRQNRGVVYSDRTRVIDMVVDGLVNREILFNMTEPKLEEFIYHCQNIYRRVEEGETGQVKAEWVTYGDRPDDFLHALVYWHIAMMKTRVVLGAGGIKPEPPTKRVYAPTVSEDQTVPGFDWKEIFKKKRRRGWKYD